MATRIGGDGIRVGGSLHRCTLFATLHDAAAIREILAHLGMARSGPSPGPAPPESGADAP